jgi:hypothetical protein
MDNTAIVGIKTTLIIKPTELDFVLNLLGALKGKGFLDFQVEREPDEPPFRQLTVKELNAILEKAEDSKDISLEAFRIKHGL